jgi:hypothetical protein
MMQNFRISDALRCILLNTPKGSNLACSGDSFTNSRTREKAILWKQALTHRRNRITLVWWNGLQLGGLASARTRAGRRVWEIDYLYLPAPDPGPQTNHNGRHASGEAASLEILEQLGQLAGWQSAERIFLRLPWDNPVIPLARRTGFFPSFQETLLEGKGEAVSNNGAGPPERKLPSILQQAASTSPISSRLSTCGRNSGQAQDEQQLPQDKRELPPNEHEVPFVVSLSNHQQRVCPHTFRHPLPKDDFALFQLFSATTPATARVALGLTFDQWRDAQELPARKKQEWVTESNCWITGWLSLSSAHGAWQGRVMAHPDHPQLLPAMVNLALSHPGPQRWLVPDYQKAVQDQLLEHNFQEVARYTMLIKTVAVPVMCPGMAPVEA